MSPRQAAQLARRLHDCLLAACAVVGVLFVAWVLDYQSRAAAYVFIAGTLGGSWLRILLRTLDLQSLRWRIRRRRYARRLRLPGGCR